VRAVATWAALSTFRRLPVSIRRSVVRLFTPHYTVGSLVLLRRGDGAILLVQQRHNSGWALPGGLAQRREAPVTTAIREVREEVGVELRPADIVPPAPAALVDPVARRVDLLFSSDALHSLEPAVPAPRGASPEVRRSGWFSPQELPRVTSATLTALRAYGLAPRASSSELV